jgi:hypothetical protein
MDKRATRIAACGGLKANIDGNDVAGCDINLSADEKVS